MTRKELFAHRDALFQKASSLMQKKNHDYGRPTDPFANFRAVRALGVDPRTGVLVRMQDKMSRLATYINTGRLEAPNEGFEDALIDIINYCSLLYAMDIEDRALVQPTVDPVIEPRPYFEPDANPKPQYKTWYSNNTTEIFK